MIKCLYRLREYEYAIENGFDYFITYIINLSNAKDDIHQVMQLNMDFAEKFSELQVTEALQNIQRMTTKDNSQTEHGEKSIFQNLLDVNHCNLGRIYNIYFDLSETSFPLKLSTSDAKIMTII